LAGVRTSLESRELKLAAIYFVIAPVPATPRRAAKSAIAISHGPSRFSALADIFRSQIVHRLALMSSHPVAVRAQRLRSGMAVLEGKKRAVKLSWRRPQRTGTSVIQRVCWGPD
jgi:hypothetical protein